MPKYLVRSPQFRPLMDGDVTPLGNVEISQDGNEWALIDVDDEQTLLDAQTDGRILEYKPESVLTVLGEIHPKVETKFWGLINKTQPLENRMGLDFPTWGITPEWQDIIDRQGEIIVGVGDTGKPSQAAMDAHAPGVEVIHVLGGNETQGQAGVIAAEGRPNAHHFAIGTLVDIEGVGVRRIEDRGGGLVGRHVDILVFSTREALNFGRQTRTVCVVE